MIVPLDKPGTPEELVHFGVKGMRWGVRKEHPLGESRFSPETKTRAKKVAIAAGTLTVAAGTAFVLYKLNQNRALKLNDVKTTAQSVKATEKILKDPVDLIHYANGKTHGFQFQRQGGTPDFYELSTKYIGDRAAPGFFKRIPGGHIATVFEDPLGRKDRAGRIILHNVIIPKHMTEGLTDIKDVTSKIWPLLEKTYKT